MEKNNRGSGILLHISSLPSPFGIGDLGGRAYQFADFLERSGQSYWQVLPFNPTSSINGDSPYSSASAFAVNTIFISLELMAEAGWLTQRDIDGLPQFAQDSVDYQMVYDTRALLFKRAYEKFKEKNDMSEYAVFCRTHADWLEDFAEFTVFKSHFQERVWSEWPREIRDRDIAAMRHLKYQCHQEIEKEKFLQYVFFKQWFALKDYCNQKGIRIIGDIPIYVTYDSADVWTHPELFKLNEHKKPAVVAGVPPDYFSKTGQLWGNPVYNWDVIRGQEYAWWVRRIEHNLKLFDVVRVDHFRGFVDYWEVPAHEKTAVHGTWHKAPAYDFFQNLLERFPGLPIIAEDLGIITDEVKEVMLHFGFPGMKILLFAFGEDLPAHPYLPHNYIPNCVAYTGTHDNNTIKGWLKSEAQEEDKKRLFEYLGRKAPLSSLHWELIRLLMSSVADTVIFPLQDVLGKGEKDRMNIPGVGQGNWQWRFEQPELTEKIRTTLFQMTRRYARVENNKHK
ncbi:MAG: 4-alpha-glucanotransferase [Candidatus Omnitrophica bacterium]|nr:4-alpha-glucanotransferase [Candidatus Omnitrophota bacterium]MCG2702889.1 4-alpha-glucanotransferase [Candidatus Omnitrophota bacterium]